MGERCKKRVCELQALLTTHNVLSPYRKKFKRPSKEPRPKEQHLLVRGRPSLSLPADAVGDDL